MALPKNVEIPKSSQFGKLQMGANKFRFLSDVITGWEGWKDKKPFRHEGDVCKIKPEQVDMNQYGNPNLNYFWAMVVWNYSTEAVEVLELTQKQIMTALYEYEKSEDWGDLKNYDVTIIKSKEGDKTKYVVQAIPPKPLTEKITEAYAESKCDLQKLFKGEYPMPTGDTEEILDDNGEPIPF